MVRIGMVRLIFVTCALATLALGMAEKDGFSFEIGSPVASQDFRTKTSAFVFRTQGCADPAKPRIEGSAEGLVNGMRRSVVLKMTALNRPGVYAVEQNWPMEGTWVVNLKGACADANAGAVVPIGPHGFLRESSKFFQRAASPAEIDAALTALTAKALAAKAGGNQ
jgi:hypothetical protein